MEWPVSKITYFSTNGTATTFPNSLGNASVHAELVAGFFYGPPGGVSTNVAHVDNYEADYFLSDIVQLLLPIADHLVNQSFGGVVSSRFPTSNSRIPTTIIIRINTAPCSSAARAMAGR